MGGLDDEFGPPAADDDLDPTHLRALAARIQTLAQVLELVKTSGTQRDRTLARIEDELKTLKQEVESILKRTQHFTDEQIEALEDIILGRDRSKWLWARVKLGVYYVSGTLVFVWTTWGLWPKISAALRGILS